MRQRPVIRALLVLALVPTWSAGCRHQLSDPLRPALPPPVEGAVPVTPLSNTTGRATDRTLMVVRLRLFTVQVPAGSVRDSEEIWSYLDEEPVGARIGSGLAHNGIRVGLGQESSWPDVAKALRRLTGRPLNHSHTLAHLGQPLPVVLRAHQDAQTIFMFRPDRTLFGRDYPPGDNLLTLTAGVNLDKPTDVLLMCTPTIRSTHRRTQYVQKSEGYVLSAEPVYYPLTTLAVQFKVPAGGFVLIGPGPEAKRAGSPGRQFLLRRQKGAEFEIVLVIAPEVFRVPVRESTQAMEPSPG